MATQYLVKQESPLMNSVRYGTSSYLPLEIEQTLELARIRKGVNDLDEHIGESLLELRDMDDDLRRGNRSLERIDETTGLMADELHQQRGSLDTMATGMGELNSSFRDGMMDVSDRMEQMGWAMEDGLAGVAEELQSGFEAVVTGLAMVDEHLGQRLAAHFSALQEQLDEQHEELVTTLADGFEQVSQAVLLSADYLGKVLTANAQAQMRQIAQEGEATRRLIAETSQRQIEKLEAVRQAVVHQDAHRAEEHFVVGLNSFNHGDTRRAYLNFLKAERIFGGHFPTLFMLGFMQYLINRLNAAQKYWQAALHQAQTAKQRGLAALYLARLYFTAKKFAQAQIWYVKAFTHDSNIVMTALVEWAAARLLEWNDTRSSDAAAITEEINDWFAGYGDATQDQYWYALALTLTPLDPAWAVAAFRQGVILDSAGAGQQNRQRVLAVLRRLNARHVDALIALVKDDYPWLA